MQYRNAMNREKAPRTVKKKPVRSDKKQATVDKLTAAVNVARKAFKHADTQESYFNKKLANTPGYYSDSMFGTSLSETLFVKTQDKYHANRWKFAKIAVKRRYQRLSALLDRINKQ